MTIRPIRELGDPVLRTPSDEVEAFDGWLAALVRDLLETVDHPGRAGLAGVVRRVTAFCAFFLLSSAAVAPGTAMRGDLRAGFGGGMTAASSSSSASVA